MEITRHSIEQKIENKYVRARFRELTGDVATHWHEFYEFELILSGNGSYVIDNIEYPIKEGRIFFINPVSFHRVHFSENTTLLNIMFTMDACDLNCLSKLFTDAPYITLNASESDMNYFCALASEIIDCIDSTESDPHYCSLILNCILEKLSRLDHRQKTVAESEIQRSILYIQNHFTEDITLTQAAQLSSYSTNYFNQKLKDMTGHTFKQYVIELRLRFAQNLLKNTNMSISQIAYRCGFKDMSNFMAAFKAKYNVTPAKFRV